MKVVILAGGYGTRINEESMNYPKPMVEIGGKPIIWHIMKYYSSFGYNEFIICCGYKQHLVKEWFADYYLHNSDVTFDFTNGNKMLVHKNIAEPWKVTLVDTGLNTMTGGRIKQIENYIGQETFMLTYGDMVSNVDINQLVEYHQKQRKLMTLTTVNIGQQFGILDINEAGKVSKFREKNEEDGTLINAGFMILEPKVFDYIKNDTTKFEKDTLSVLSNEKEVSAYIHRGFWQRLDTQRDLEKLENLIETNQAPWKIWE
jgi:glucose-1-phosphate cytidylyltransferase